MIITGAVVGYFMNQGLAALAGAGIGLAVELAAYLEQLLFMVTIQSWRDRHAEAERLRKENAKLAARLHAKEFKPQDDEFEDD